MKSFICPFCDHLIPNDSTTVRGIHSSFKDLQGIYSNGDYNYQIYIMLIHCPACEKTTFRAFYTGKLMDNNISITIYPKSFAKIFPEYIPKQIREDYEEAYAVLNYSPKASATLSRRCLQGMIRDFWGITKSTLFQEIDALKEHIPAQQFKAIDSLRKLGNIGAHMSKDTNLIIDIDPDEAAKLLKLIEILLNQWYVNRHEQETLYNDIVEIVSKKH